jgi:hypothetical protein
MYAGSMFYNTKLAYVDIRAVAYALHQQRRSFISLFSFPCSQIAAFALTPWVSKCDKKLLPLALETGAWLSIGYIAQVLAFSSSSH